MASARAPLRLLGAASYENVPRKRPDTVGESPSAEICMSHMPSLKAKKLGKLAQEKVLLEL